MQSFFARWLTPPGPHALLYRLSGGLFGARLPSVTPRVLLLTVRGRRSGRELTTPVVYFEFDDGVAIAGTNGGGDNHPAWFLNLQSDPSATIQINRRKRAVRAYVPSGDERSRYWEEICLIHPLFAWYQRQTTREIPVVVLREAA
jgi:deazaflavin-dependent oxidoreductase (nitroreductase family)